MRSATDSEIFSMNADGSGDPTQLAVNSVQDFEPAYSPDGTKIAFESRLDSDPEIYVMNTDGTNQIPLTNNAVLDAAAAWSPGGTKIAFESRRTGNDEIYVMKPTPESRKNRPVDLSRNSTGADLAPNWSPDGTKIAFDSNRGGNGEIYVMNPNGASPQNVTTSSADETNGDWQPG